MRLRCAGKRLLAAALLFCSLSVALAAETPGGIGLAVVPTAEGELVVLKVVDRTPAAAAGMRAGDLIVQIDDVSLRGSNFIEVSRRHLPGDVGSPVTLKFLRPGETGVHTVTLKRIPLDPDGTDGPGTGAPDPGRR